MDEDTEESARNNLEHKLEQLQQEVPQVYEELVLEIEEILGALKDRLHEHGIEWDWRDK